MRVVSRVDGDGFFVEDVVLKNGESSPQDCIDSRPEQGFYKPKWTGEEWVEGADLEILLANRQEQERQKQIVQLESLLEERYASHGRLLATNAEEVEIEEVKDEIALILAELGGLYDA